MKNSKKTTAKVAKKVTTKTSKNVKKNKKAAKKATTSAKAKTPKRTVKNTAIRVNKETGYRGVNKVTYPSGKVKFRARLMFKGDEYGSVYNTPKEAALAVNKLAVKLFGKRVATKKRIINTI